MQEPCRKIWVWAPTGNHSAFILRVKDIPLEQRDFLRPYELPDWVKFVGFSIYNIEVIEGTRARIAGLLPSPAAIEITLYAESPESIPPLYVQPIRTSQSAIDSLTEYVHSEIAQNDEGNPVFVRRFDPTQPRQKVVDVSVAALRPYSALNVCHDWVIRGLRGAGLRKVPQSVYSGRIFLDHVALHYPSESQFCNGYRNETSGAMRNVHIIKK